MARPVALIVDDDRDVIEAMCRYLSAENFECAVARDGISALRLAMSVSPLAAFLDVHMPIMDGISVLRRIKEVRPYTKVVMMSAAASAEEVDVAIGFGAYRFLMKPHDLYNIEEIIDEVLYGNLPDIPSRVNKPGYITIWEKQESFRKK